LAPRVLRRPGAAAARLDAAPAEAAASSAAAPWAPSAVPAVRLPAALPADAWAASRAAAEQPQARQAQRRARSDAAAAAAGTLAAAASALRVRRPWAEPRGPPDAAERKRQVPAAGRTASPSVVASAQPVAALAEPSVPPAEAVAAALPA
jgi:hypothetical protein